MVINMGSCLRVSLFFKIYFIQVQLIYNVVLISAVQQSDSLIHIHIYMYIYGVLWCLVLYLSLLAILSLFLGIYIYICICIYIYTFFLIFFSFMVYHKILNIFPCAIQQDLVVIHSTYNSMYLLISNSQSIPPPSHLPLDNHKSVLQVCVSVSQISSFVSYFRFYI